MTDTARRDFEFLERAGFVLVALQFAILGCMWMTDGFDRASDGFPIFVVCTTVFVTGQRRLAARPPNRGAARWIYASRAAVLTMLALGTLAVGLYRIVPDAAPAPAFILRGLFALLWVIIALKGAGIGKLKPGSAIGLCVSWTRQSRLAWERAHRALGRILFWGGLIGLATSLIVAPLVSFAMWAATVALAVAAALIESWRTWRLDPGRSGGRPA
jgi:immunity protein, SdpI family